MKKNIWVRSLVRTLGVVLITITVVALTLVLSIGLLFSDISVSARELFVTTMLETGNMKFVPSLFLSDGEIQKIVDSNSMVDIDVEEDLDLIDVDKNNKSKIELVQIEGRTFLAKMLIVNDPSRVSLATTYPWGEYGKELHELVAMDNSIAGVNGGLYQSAHNKGGYPVGLVVSKGKILFNKPNLRGLYLIGLDNDNILRVISLEGMSEKDVKKLVEDEGIRDAVTFQEESSDKNNHFVKLVVNGERREMQGRGSGANPRTAIGQRKDGSILLLVTDGRGSAGHLGATASDLIDIMMDYGAVNAANLDGGSSSSMYYKGNYEMTSVTMYYSNSSWRLPNAFVVE
jgi:exopolysaccharide biosynthesis protein